MSPDSTLSGNRGGHASTSGVPSTPSAEAWRLDFATNLPRIEELARSTPCSQVTTLRSAQVDAARLDDELTTMLREQFSKIYAHFDPQAITRLEPELTALLDLMVFWFSVWTGKATPGSMLLNLRYRDERSTRRLAAAGAAAAADSQAGGSNGGGLMGALRKSTGGGRTGVEGPGLSPWQRAGLGLGWVALRYCWVRACMSAAARHWADEEEGSARRRAWEAMRRAEAAVRAAGMINFLVFLRTGTYRSLLERLLSARLVYSRPAMARAVSFEYLNRQLVWSEVSELFLFLLPLLDIRRVKAAVRRTLWAGGVPALFGWGAPTAASMEDAASGSGSSSTMAAACGVCGRREMALEYEAVPCGHRFCYYCLRSNTEAAQQYECPTCLVRVVGMRRVRTNPCAKGGAAGGGGDEGSCTEASKELLA